MAVLRRHLADPSGGWPVHRGLALLRGLVADEGRRVCLMCACARPEACHRTVVAGALLGLLPPGVVFRDLSG